MTDTAPTTRRIVEARIGRSLRVGYNWHVAVTDRETGRVLTTHNAVLALGVEAFIERLQTAADVRDVQLVVIDETPTARFITGLAR
jgi:hypothetical protein